MTWHDRLGRKQDEATALNQWFTQVAGWFAPLARSPRVPGGSWRLLGERTAAATAAVGSLCVIVIAMYTVDGRAISGVQRLPVALVDTFEWITDFGLSGWFLWPLGTMLILSAALAPRLRSRFQRLVLSAIVARIGFLFVAIALPGLIVTITKRLIGRSRPMLSGVADPFAYKLWVWDPAFASLPSGHATTAFAAAVAFGALWPQARIVMWLYAGLIAASRVVVSAHHVSDVIAGAVAGTVGAVLIRNWFAVRRIGFAVSLDGKVRALPGPSLRRIGKLVLHYLARK
jgi:undecaprenyl-diphosphatase